MAYEIPRTAHHELHLPRPGPLVPEPGPLDSAGLRSPAVESIKSPFSPSRRPCVHGSTISGTRICTSRSRCRTHEPTVTAESIVTVEAPRVCRYLPRRRPGKRCGRRPRRHSLRGRAIHVRVAVYPSDRRGPRVRRALVPGGPAVPGSRARPHRADLARLQIRSHGDLCEHPDGGDFPRERGLPGLRPPRNHLPAPMGLATRYVSGYLMTDPPPGQPKLVGADASHAWVSVYSPQQGAGSISIQPTTRCPSSVTSPWPGAAITATSARSKASFSAAANTGWTFRRRGTDRGELSGIAGWGQGM